MEGSGSPLKKIKLQHATDGAMDDVAVSAGDKPMADAPSTTADQTVLQLDKEVQCGITEFISSNHQAFTGVLKKRYVLPCVLSYRI